MKERKEGRKKDRMDGGRKIGKKGGRKKERINDGREEV